jgi:hypothetical protein
MPRIAPTDRRIGYDLICFDKSGDERRDDPDGLMSDLILRTLAAADSGVTDVFLVSHGWKGDIPAARTQFDGWVEAMTQCKADFARARQVRPGFKPYVIGLHWPSLPWGDESIGDATAFDVPADAGTSVDPVTALVDDYAPRIADTPVARDALRRIAQSGMDNVEPEALSPEVVDAYRQLNLETDLGIGGAGAGPGGDRSGFDPQAVYQSLREDAPSFGLFGLGGLFGVLRTLSFWRMKDRARRFGEMGGSNFLACMMQAAPRNLRFHLLGHSFGCIVMSATLAGPRGRGRVARPVDSLALVQGALSIWSYCDDIPATPGQPGYFHKVLADRRVRGPVLATQSVFDRATGKWYPLGAGVAGQVAFGPGEVPKFGAVGSHGIRGPGTNAAEISILPADGEYKFEPGKVYNLESSAVIKDSSGRGGAHSDICHCELAHAVWQAALAPA